MITLQTTEKLAEMAKIKLNEEELCKAQKELCRLADFAEKVSEAALSADVAEEAPSEKERNEDRLFCEMNIKSLPKGSTNIKDGFFRMEAGERK